MNHTAGRGRGLLAVAAAGLAALVVAGCGSSDSKSPAAAPTSAAPTPPAAGSPAATPTGADATTAPATPSGDPAAVPAPGSASGDSSLSLTGSGGSGSYAYRLVNCVGEAKPTGWLTISPVPKGDTVVVTALAFKDGQAELLLTTKDGNRITTWKGKAPVGEHASRTGNAAKLTGLPVTDDKGATGTVSGTLTCANTLGLR
ncbi:hypothetical protein [Streptomyces rubellomurinus]|uniref:hypothetical protein n=1 Tax=Streptomyces rubellomurinus (strain ATCC 31215) TaxID=359131 RepID=UPI000697E4C4|nr:hypothetical protein [Streptomyces rubellomurinus]